MIYFDHDLGENLTGYDCAKWLVTYCLEQKAELPVFTVHSANPTGERNIRTLLANFARAKDVYNMV